MRRQLGVGLSMLGFGVFRIALLMGRRQLAFGKFGVRPIRWWSKRASNCWPPAKLRIVAGRSSLVSTRARRRRSGGGSFGFVLFGEPFHRAGLPYGLGGLRFAALLRLPERGSGNGADARRRRQGRGRVGSP